MILEQEANATPTDHDNRTSALDSQRIAYYHGRLHTGVVVFIKLILFSSSELLLH